MTGMPPKDAPRLPKDVLRLKTIYDTPVTVILHPRTGNKELKKFENAALMDGKFALDTETTGLSWYDDRILMIQLYCPTYGVLVIPFSWGSHYYAEDPDLQSFFKAIMNTRKTRKYFWNVKFDLHFMRSNGVYSYNAIKLYETVDDGAVLSYITSRESFPVNGLKARASVDLGLDMTDFKEFFKKTSGKRVSADKIKIEEYPLEQVCEYAAKDPVATYYEVEHLLAKLEAEDSKVKTIYYKIERPLVSCLYDMEKEGVPISADEVEEQFQRGQKEIEKRVQKIFLLAGQVFNINSKQQLVNLMVERFGFNDADLTYTKKGSAKADADALDEYIAIAAKRGKTKCVNFLMTIKEYNVLLKQFTTYITNLRKQDTFLPDVTGATAKGGVPKGKWHETYYRNGRIHPSFNQIGARTGRFSSSSPNVQNWPRWKDPEERDESEKDPVFEIRKCIVAPWGDTIIDFDYSQIELRVLAQMSKEPKLIEAFRKGVDVHRWHAALVFNKPMEEVTKEERFFMKQTLSFGVLYGMFAKSLAAQLGISVRNAEKLITEYFKRNKYVDKFIKRTKRFMHKSCYVSTLLGRRRWFPKIKTTRSSYEVGGMERQGVNTRIQGGASDLVKLSMVECWKDEVLRKNNVRMFIQVHDQLSFLCPVEKSVEMMPYIKNLAEKFPVAKKLIVPLVADIGKGKDWASAHV